MIILMEIQGYIYTVHGLVYLVDHVYFILVNIVLCVVYMIGNINVHAALINIFVSGFTIE